MSLKDGCNNDMGWWSDPDGEIASPPYLDTDPGQIGSDLDSYAASKVGYATGQYPDGTRVPGTEVDTPEQRM